MIKQIFQLIRNMGMRYTTYRICHELEKKLGILKRRHPINPIFKSFISVDEWRNSTVAFVISSKENLAIQKQKNQNLQTETEKIKNGEVCFFSWDWKNLGSDYDWITNPDSGYKYDIKKHWSEIPDLSTQGGDIKYVWEKSRFSYLLKIIRSDYHNDTDNAEFVFSEIENWIDANPINQGPNWRCSQEISLRILNWTFALHFYKNAAALTENRWQKIQHVIYWSLHHVYHHIDFSRIAVRNNHAITETLFLALSNMLFPFIQETEKWAKKGRLWLEEEIDYQIYDDGTYLQFSMNYHRVVVQLLSLGISISEKNKQPFSENVKQKSLKSVDFLYQCLQEENGFLPNYGANDGAWFFPLSDTDYRDFRPQLNTLHKILTDAWLFENDIFTQEFYWLSNQCITDKLAKLDKKQGIIRFPIGGYYLIRETNTFTFIKCGSYKDRPSQADNLHIDLWHKGENLLFDGGTYKYNTQKKITKYFIGTSSHNTVMLDNYDQMLKGARFIWTYWSQAEKAQFSENNEMFYFDGTINAFTYLSKKIRHRRQITKLKNSPTWIIKDEIINKPDKVYLHQLWHTENKNIAISSTCKPKESVAWRSLYYGRKQNIQQIDFETNGTIVESKITIE